MKLTTARLKKLIREEIQRLNEMNSYVYAWVNELAGPDGRKYVDDTQIRDMIDKSGLNFENYLSGVKKVMSEAGASIQDIKEVEGRIRGAYDLNSGDSEI